MTPAGPGSTQGSMSSPKHTVLTIQTAPAQARKNSDWLGTSLLTARTISAAAESVPYLKGVFGVVVILLETVETVKRNREELKGLCVNVMEIITIVRDQIALHGDTAAVKFKGLCRDLEECLDGVLQAVRELERKPDGLPGRFKEIIRGKKTADKIVGYERKIQELRSNFVLTATMDTNFQVHKVLTVMSPVESIPPKQNINNCPPPSRIFHGRQYILDKMCIHFTDDLPGQHIFLLHGLGGAGKTQIGLKFIQNLSFHFSDVFLIDSSTTDTIETGLKYIAGEKHVGSTPQDALKWLISEPHGWLLFFDNADDPQINLNKYFPQCNHGNIIITSRNPGLCVYATSHCLVSDMEETEAIELLLKSAAQEMTSRNNESSAQIVKALSYFPLAIIQAGAFISKSGALNSYLALYMRNRARLLSEKPAQSHDEYAWTVYTTWYMSFEKLSQTAATVLQLCSLLHHQGICEEIFQNATKYKSNPGQPSQGELQRPVNFLSQFLGPAGNWESLHFMDVTNELRAYSLITIDWDTNMFSIHPLVHSWLRSTLSDAEADNHCMVAIVGMCIATMHPKDKQPAALWLFPHIESLLKGKIEVIPDFNHEYGEIYAHSGKFKKAEELETFALEKRKKSLGEDHPDTLMLMWGLACTYHRLGQFKKAEDLETFVLEKQTLTLGMDHSDTLATMNLLSVTLIELEKFEEAEKLQSFVLEKRRNSLGEDAPNTLISMGNLGWILHNLGRLREAEEIQVLALEKQQKILGPEHPETLWIMGNLGSTYRHLGQLKHAEELESFVLEKQRKILGEDHPHTLWTMGNLALTYREQGHLGIAQEVLVSVVKKIRRSLGDEHPETVRAKRELDSTSNALAQSKQPQNPQVILEEDV